MSEVKQYSVEEMLGSLKDTSKSNSTAAAETLLRAASDAGMPLRDYMRYAIDPTKGDFSKGVTLGANGYQMGLAYLGLPVKDDIDSGVLLRAAEDTFATYTGVRALFPAVMDDVMQWKARITNISSIDQLVAQSRTVSGSNELITTVVDDDKDRDYKMASIAEGGRIPVQRIKATEQAVKFFKHGMGYEYTYEFGRRANIELFVPYLARAQRVMENSKVSTATGLLINGDGIHGAASEYAQNADGGVTATGLQYEGILRWLAEKSKEGIQIDTIVGNVKTYVDYLMLFGPVLSGTGGDPKAYEATGGPSLSPNVPGMFTPVKFVISADVPDNKLIGIVKGETLEELKEAGSEIEESETAIRTQTVTVVRSNNSGFRLVFDDTRSVYTWSDT